MRIPVEALAKGFGVAVPIAIEILRTYSNATDRQKLDESAIVEVDVKAADASPVSAKDPAPDPPKELLATIPRAQGKRRVIAISTPDMIGPHLEVDAPGVAVLAAPSQAPKARLDAELYRRNLLVPGAVLIQSPLDPNTYQPLDEAAVAFALDKLLLYDRVAGLLGATKFSVGELQVASEAGSLTIHGGVEASIGDMKGNFDKGQEKNFRSFMEVGSTNRGGEPDIAAAQKVAHGAGLGSDPALKHLIDVIRDGRKKTQSIRLNLTQEAKRNISLGASLGSKLGVSGSTGGSQDRSNLRDIQIVITVEFGDAEARGCVDDV